MKTLELYVRSFYANWKYEKLGRGEYNLNDARIALENEIVDAYIEGLVEVDIKVAARRVLDAADRSTTDRGKSVFMKEMKLILDGHMSIDGGAWLNVVIPLGANARVHVCDMGMEEYERAHHLRYRNKQQVNEEWRVWDQGTGLFVPHFQTGLTVGQIVERGLITGKDRILTS